MKYGLTISDQISHFLFAVGFGFLLGFLYRVTVSVRKMISRKKAAVIAQDILFCVVLTVLCFVFLLVYSDGEIRIDLFAAIGVGALIYFLTFDKSVAAVLKPLTAAVRKLIRLVFKPFVLIGSLVKKCMGKIKAAFSKTAHSFKGKFKGKTKVERRKEKRKKKREKTKEKS